MRLPVDGRSAGALRLTAALIPALALAACGAGGDGAAGDYPLASTPAYGPSGDYPVVVGDPYTVGNVTYTPEDGLNYDQVGYLVADMAGGDGVSASHHTLPLPSYVEVTSLESGRTILVRVERRGPMDSNDLLALSHGALTQLQAAAGTPVRVRRVNPPEDQRAMLRTGNPADLRMDTPMSLVEILKRKLTGQPLAPVQVAAVSPEQPEQPQPPVTAEAPELPAFEPVSEAASADTTQPAPAPAADEGRFTVQAAAFSTAERAENAARTLDGQVVPSGRYFRVRTGPFVTRGEAEASLAKVRAAGYSDARILTNG